MVAFGALMYVDGTYIGFWVRPEHATLIFLTLKLRCHVSILARFSHSGMRPSKRRRKDLVEESEPPDTGE